MKLLPELVLRRCPTFIRDISLILSLFFLLLDVQNARAQTDPVGATLILQSWQSAPWSGVSGATSFSGSLIAPESATPATFTFSNARTGVIVTTPSAPDFSAAAASYFGFESTGFGVGDSTTGRFSRGESFELESNFPFHLQEIYWAEVTGDEVVCIQWTSQGVSQSETFNITAAHLEFSDIEADAGTPIVITNVSDSTANLSGRLRIRYIATALAIEPEVTAGTTIDLQSWKSTPWSGVSGATSFGASIADPDGGTSAAFTFGDPRTGVNVTTASTPDFSPSAVSYFGFESTGFGVGDSTTGRFNRGESFTLQADRAFELQKIKWAEYTGDEALHIQWTSGGIGYETDLGVTANPSLLSAIQADANTPVVITNTSSTTANLTGRLRVNQISVALLNGSAADPDQMFGVNLSGGEFGTVPGTYGTNYIYPNTQEFDYFYAKGLNLIRLPFKWERVQTSLNAALNTNEMLRIDTVIGYAHARGMKVILDMHNYARYNGNVIGTTAVPNSAFQDVWRRIADRYKDETAIYGYGIMNEPHGTDGLWPAAAQAGADGIREVDSTHWIIVGGDGWSSSSGWVANNPDLDVQDTADRVMYEAHCYFDSDSSGTYDATYDVEGAYPNIGVVRASPFVNWLHERNARGFFGEYGVPNDDTRWNVVLDRFLAYLSANGLSGTYWSAGPWWGSYALSVEPTSSFTVDAPQMTILQNYH